MKFLVDTNVILEVILAQEKSEEAKSFLTNVQGNQLFITDFSLHSIGLLLFQRNQHNVFEQFYYDMIIGTGIIVISLNMEEIKNLVQASVQFNLDFDDSYQYYLAKKFNLTVVSFDKDFDKTDFGRKTPAEII
ncbi:MAG: PIN domain-containing protein [Bacteroidota bacterium]|nr:PIN domain-containing protein [Bacteroidota bacterium]